MARVSFVGMKRVLVAIGWVVLFYVCAYAAAYGLVHVVPLPQGVSDTLAADPILLLESGAFEVIGLGLATYIFGRLINKHSWSELGWRRPAFRSWFRGLALGVVMASFAVAMGIVFGARVRITGHWSAWAPVALPLIAGLMLAALGEELGFRGYPMRHLSQAIGVLPAIVVLALPFAFAHITNPYHSLFGLINVGLAAIWLALAFFSAGGMPLAWGAHFGWNAGLALLFGAPVSGYRFHVSAVEYTPGFHSWLDGGWFGPEGGVVATIALLGGSLFLLTRPSAFSPPSPDGRGGQGVRTPDGRGGQGVRTPDGRGGQGVRTPDGSGGQGVRIA